MYKKGTFGTPVGIVAAADTTSTTTSIITWLKTNWMYVAITLVVLSLILISWFVANKYKKINHVLNFPQAF